jgi:putative ATPase
MMQPLAHRIRPQSIDEVVGQTHIVGKGKLLNQLIDQQSMFSLILFGPPGVGKTTLASILCDSLHIPFTSFNAATDNKSKLTGIIETAKLSKDYLIIIDEIHRLKKDTQDVLLPYLEDGTCYIIGLTTTNPYYSVNPAIRSRCHILECRPLESEDVEKRLKSILLASKTYFNKSITATDEVIKKITQIANGDLRSAINLLELAILSSQDDEIDLDDLDQLYTKTNFTIDKDGDGHYDTLSAFQKSIRGSDVNAALHYLARLVIAGDLESICRRLSVIAFEDIGLANPMAAVHTMAAIDCAHQVGLPEARHALSNAVIELALSPKSRSGHDAINEAIEDIHKGLIGDIPEFIKYNPLNPPFQYSAEDPNKYKYQYLPDKLKYREYYKPKEVKNTYESNLVQNYKILKQKKDEYSKTKNS